MMIGHSQLSQRFALILALAICSLCSCLGQNAQKILGSRPYCESIEDWARQVEALDSRYLRLKLFDQRNFFLGVWKVADSNRVLVCDYPKSQVAFTGERPCQNFTVTPIGIATTLVDDFQNDSSPISLPQVFRSQLYWQDGFGVYDFFVGQMVQLNLRYNEFQVRFPGINDALTFSIGHVEPPKQKGVFIANSLVICFALLLVGLSAYSVKLTLQNRKAKSLSGIGN